MQTLRNHAQPFTSTLGTIGISGFLYKKLLDIEAQQQQSIEEIKAQRQSIEDIKAQRQSIEDIKAQQQRIKDIEAQQQRIEDKINYLVLSMNKNFRVYVYENPPFDATLEDILYQGIRKDRLA